MFFTVDQSKCKHNQGFSFGGVFEGPKKVGWHCMCGCSFYLNFDPDKFPGGIAIVKGKEGRDCPPLVSSKY